MAFFASCQRGENLLECYCLFTFLSVSVITLYSMEENREQNQATEEKENYLSIGGLFMEMVRVFLLAVVIIIPVRVFLFQPFFVQGSSMEPNFEDGEYLIISEFGYKQTDVGLADLYFTVNPFKDIARQDIAVFHSPQKNEQFFIKRIIGLPGEAVEIRQGKVIVYNKEHSDGFILDESAYLGKDVLTRDTPRIEVAADEYFVMGDNRMFSYDSRAFGPIKKNKIVGRVLLRAWPTGRFLLY